eukprot:770067-Rhodomonas_salina.2
MLCPALTLLSDFFQDRVAELKYDMLPPLEQVHHSNTLPFSVDRGRGLQSCIGDLGLCASMLGPASRVSVRAGASKPHIQRCRSQRAERAGLRS